MMADCLFCKIVNGSIPCKKVYEDEEFLAFHDIHPKAPVHVLVIPKRHIPSLADAQAEDALLLGRLLICVTQVADRLGLRERGWRTVFNTRKDAGQEIFHIHAHILGGKRLPF